MLFGKLRIAWCQYAYADNDAAIIMGWVQGYPKSSASSVRPVPLLPRVRHLRLSPVIAALPVAYLPMDGRGGRARVILHKKVDRLVGLFDRPILARRYFPRLNGSVMDNILITNGWIGCGELKFPETHGEERNLLGPIKMGRGYRLTLSFRSPTTRVWRKWPSSSLPD
jgi:hypothetical protein